MFLALFFLFSGLNTSAQKPSIEKGYFLFPIRPGEVNYLSGTMGELRPHHFHGGIDIKTGGVTGVPVHAAADGYISRLKVSTSGYGNVLYIAHPNGTTTVYAHLDSFEKELAKYVREMQYKQKTFEIELFPDKNQFSYKRGDVIALSGNSGGSGGPHLHFEVRDANQDVLNPLSYGFEEIKDEIAPLVYGVAVKALQTGSRVNHQFGRFEYRPTLKGSTYVLDKPIEVWGKVGLEILAYDKFNGADNSNGFPCIEVQVNGKEIFSHNLDKFSFAQTRHIEVHMDYATRKTSGNKYIHLYLADGNELSFYKYNEQKGAIIATQPDSVMDVQINLSDLYGNLRQVKLQLKATEPKTTVGSGNPGKLPKPVVQENTLKFYAPVKGNSSQVATVYANRMAYELAPAYFENGNAVYLWDLRVSLPDSIDACQEIQRFNFKAKVPSVAEYNLYLPEMDLNFPARSLFDTLYLQTDYRQEYNKEIFGISEDLQPLASNMYVKLKPRQEYPDKARTHVYSYGGNGRYGWEGGSWENDNIKFRTKNLGEYTILTDSVPPTVKPVRINSSSLSFQISDNLSGINSFEAYVNDEWVLMNYDHKRRAIWSEKLDDSKPFKGAVVLKVKDQAGNEKVYSTNL